MLLTKNLIKELYEFVKNGVSYDELVDKYQIKIDDDNVYYSINIYFKHGRDYEEEGIISKKCYEWAMKHFKNGNYLCLGDVNGKYSDVTVNLNDGLTFSLDYDDIETYIYENGIYKNNSIFYEKMSGDNDYSDED